MAGRRLGKRVAGRAWAPPFQGEEARGKVQVGLRGPVASGVEFIKAAGVMMMW